MARVLFCQACDAITNSRQSGRTLTFTCAVCRGPAEWRELVDGVVRRLFEVNVNDCRFLKSIKIGVDEHEVKS